MVSKHAEITDTSKFLIDTPTNVPAIMAAELHTP